MAKRGKIIVTGHRGQLGRDFMTGLADTYECVGFDLPETDVADRTALSEALDRERPDVVIHAAAYTE